MPQRSLVQFQSPHLLFKGDKMHIYHELKFLIIVTAVIAVALILD